MKILQIPKIPHFFKISNFFKIFFDFEKKRFFFETKNLKSKICPGTRKSHLENRAIILKIRNRKNSLFFLLMIQIRFLSIPGWRILCVAVVVIVAVRQAPAAESGRALRTSQRHAALKVHEGGGAAWTLHR